MSVDSLVVGHVPGLNPENYRVLKEVITQPSNRPGNQLKGSEKTYNFAFLLYEEGEPVHEEVMEGVKRVAKHKQMKAIVEGDALWRFKDPATAARNFTNGEGGRRFYPVIH